MVKFLRKVNGISTVLNDIDDNNVKMDYYMINLKKDLYFYAKYDCNTVNDFSKVTRKLSKISLDLEYIISDLKKYKEEIDDCNIELDYALADFKRDNSIED